jgi:hypothetical protein
VACREYWPRPAGTSRPAHADAFESIPPFERHHAADQFFFRAGQAHRDEQARFFRRRIMSNMAEATRAGRIGSLTEVQPRERNIQ